MSGEREPHEIAANSCRASEKTRTPPRWTQRWGSARLSADRLLSAHRSGYSHPSIDNTWIIRHFLAKIARVFYIRSSKILWEPQVSISVEAVPLAAMRERRLMSWAISGGRRVPELCASSLVAHVSRNRAAGPPLNIQRSPQSLLARLRSRRPIARDRACKGLKRLNPRAEIVCL